jgi:hypothetical protein
VLCRAVVVLFFFYEKKMCYQDMYELMNAMASCSCAFFFLRTRAVRMKRCETAGLDASGDASGCLH